MLSWKQGTLLIPHHKSCPSNWRKDIFEARLLLCFIFFSQKMITAQVTLPIFLQTCVFLTVWEVFVFFKPWLALCEVDFCYCDIVVVYPWLTIRIITDGHEFKFWLVSVFFPFHLLFFLLFVVVFFISPCFYCLSCLLNLSNYKHKKMLD